jgi:alkanesulfonate monooxygenase SsuD/methylene tetrahydromethanopterin reductase-like flavin-dependent oxidoreductase (luciferase family)
VWAADHLVSLVGFPQRARVDTWTALTWLATATKRLRLGSLVSPVTWRQPSLLALTAASVDALSGGRLEVGIGAGWNAYEHEAFGIDLPEPTTRWRMLDESAQVLRLLWSQEEASFKGRYFTLKRAHCHPRPVQRPSPPLVIGGIGETRTLPIVARRADEWNAYSLTPKAYHAKVAALERHCEQAGRPMSAIRRSIAAPLATAASEAGVQIRIDRLTDVFPLPLQFPPELAPFTPKVLRERGWLVGTPPQVVEQIQALKAEGVHRVMLHHLDVEDHESLALVASDILPAVQARILPEATADPEPGSPAHTAAELNRP